MEAPGDPAGQDGTPAWTGSPIWTAGDSCCYVCHYLPPLHGLTLVVILLGLSSQWPACSSSL